MKDYRLISNIYSNKAWYQIFQTCLEHCNKFKIIYPIGEFDPENPLLRGKEEFVKLPNSKILKWDRMEDSISIEGELTADAKKLFLKYTEPSFTKHYSELWWFQLLKNGIEFIEVEDFSVWSINNESELPGLVQQKGIKVSYDY